MNISVCMATYNGSACVAEQVASILKQLKPGDELIIVDDCSTDKTVEVVRNFSDPRIKIYFNERNRSHVFSFGRAISLASNDIIMMSDQDDIWIEGRLDLMIKKLTDTGALLVSTNSSFIDMNGEPTSYPLDRLKESDSTKYIKNISSILIGKKNYYGCAMALNRKLIDTVLPIPDFVESHDLWIAMAANILGSNAHIENDTLYRRVHKNNASIISRKLLPKLWSRVVFLRSILVLLYRGKIKRNKLKHQ